MKLFFVNYASESFLEYQKESIETMNNEADAVIPYTKTWLETTPFYKDNQSILDEKRGAGYWLWKPFIILNTVINYMNEGDGVLYVDCGDRINPGVGEYVKSSLENMPILLVQGKHPNKCWTKRDCFSLMGCDSEPYWDAIQLEAGVCAFRKNETSFNFLNEWFSHCKNKNIITDLESTGGEGNFDCFQDHRHDQSILTNLSVKHNIPSEYATIRKYVTCNAYD